MSELAPTIIGVTASVGLVLIGGLWALSGRLSRIEAAQNAGNGNEDAYYRDTKGTLKRIEGMVDRVDKRVDQSEEKAEHWRERHTVAHEELVKSQAVMQEWVSGHEQRHERDSERAVGQR